MSHHVPTRCRSPIGLAHARLLGSGRDVQTRVQQVRGQSFVAANPANFGGGVSDVAHTNDEGANGFSSICM